MWYVAVDIHDCVCEQRLRQILSPNAALGSLGCLHLPTNFSEKSEMARNITWEEWSYEPGYLEKGIE